MKEGQDVTVDDSHYFRISFAYVGSILLILAGGFGAYISSIEGSIQAHVEYENQRNGEIKREFTELLKGKAEKGTTNDRYTGAQARERDKRNEVEHQVLRREIDHLHDDLRELSAVCDKNHK